MNLDPLRIFLSIEVSLNKWAEENDPANKLRRKQEEHELLRANKLVRFYHHLTYF